MVQPGSRVPSGTSRRSDRVRRAANVRVASSRVTGSESAGSRKTGAAASEEAAAAALTLQFLDFIADGRTYAETMEAWRSNCPRMPIWENAVRDGLVGVESNGGMKSSRIVLTAKGAAHRRHNALG
jgi:hypothetical protein